MFLQRGVVAALGAALLALGTAQHGLAQQSVRIGAIYPLSAPSLAPASDA